MKRIIVSAAIATAILVTAAPASARPATEDEARALRYLCSTMDANPTPASTIDAVTRVVKSGVSPEVVISAGLLVCPQHYDLMMQTFQIYGES